jgi:hypothetical protein
MKREWDYPSTMKYHRRPRIEQVEILPPQQPEPLRVVVRHRHSFGSAGLQRLVIAGAIFFLLMTAIRAPGGLLLAAILVGWKLPLAAALVALVLAIVSYRDRRHGRQF